MGKYPAYVKSGAGYFYDEVLEYRVWIHPEAGGKDFCNGNDYFYSFVTYEEALEFSISTQGAEEPLALILQKEHINEPQPNAFVHVKDKRIAEWQVEWLKDRKRKEDSIQIFLKEHDIKR